MSLQHLVRDYAPGVVHNAAISVFNYLQYRKRHGGEYDKWQRYFATWRTRSAEAWQREQEKRLGEFMRYVLRESPYFREKYAGVEVSTLDALRQLDVMSKTELIQHVDQIRTVSPNNGIRSDTGGTTGNSLTIYFTPENMQERFGLLRAFRGEYGYKLGKPSAWFSGKELLSARDIRNGIYYKDDYLQRIRYFSTFHITERTFSDYWRALTQQKPRFLFGFPSSVVDLCRLAKQHGQRADFPVSAFFSTSEVVTQADRQLVEEVLGCRIVDQYASAEGAPFILQCRSGRYHLNPLTGVFEVVDGQLNPTREGELLVTSFTTRGVPLVRYRIGDRVVLSDLSQCECGCHYPIVERIEGRDQDYAINDVGARVSAVNISNCSKHVEGVTRFQLEQHTRGEVFVSVEANERFNNEQREHLTDALRERLGEQTRIHLTEVDRIPRAASGKFRVVINRLPESERL